MSCNSAISFLKDEVLIKIHVIPGSSKSLFPAGYNIWRQCIEIKIKAAAKENKANREIIEKISKYFNILPKDIYIVSGNKGREKTVSIKNIKKRDVCRKIEESLNGL
jgi:uncharacterized protein (TIGR00251 family)